MGISGTPFYHVCETCNAKFFSRKRFEACPRCSSVSRSRDRLLPPWSVSECKRRDKTRLSTREGTKKSQSRQKRHHKHKRNPGEAEAVLFSWKVSGR
jgi:hypothetical protein